MSLDLRYFKLWILLDQDAIFKKNITCQIHIFSIIWKISFFLPYSLLLLCYKSKNAQIDLKGNPQLNTVQFKREDGEYLTPSWLLKALKGNVVNQACYCINEELHKFKLHGPLRGWCSKLVPNKTKFWSTGKKFQRNTSNIYSTNIYIYI